MGQEEKRGGSPGKGDLERSCLGFGNLRGRYTQADTQERQEEKVESFHHPNRHFNSPRPTTPYDPGVQKYQAVKQQFHSSQSRGEAVDQREPVQPDLGGGVGKHVPVDQ